MWTHIDLLTHSRIRRQELIAEADQHRLVKLARRHRRTLARGRGQAKAAGDGYVTARPAPAC